MALTDNNGNGLSAADVAAVVGNNGGMFGNGLFGGDGFMSILILFFFMMLFGGMGGNWGNNGGGAMPYVVNNMDSTVQRGFDQQAIIGGLNGINSSITTLAQGQCNGFNNVVNAVTNSQFATAQSMNSLAMGLQNYSYDNRAAIADLKYTVATEACADRAAVNDALNALTNVINAGFTGIHNELCQDRLEAKDLRIRELENQLNLANFNTSQVAQTAQLEAFIRANQTTPAAAG